MKPFLVLFFLSFFTLSFGQIKFQTEDLSEVRKNKNHIELGLSSFSRIWNGTATGTLLFKRSYTGGDLIEVNSIKLLRAFVTANTQINFTDDPSRIQGDTSVLALHPRNQTSFTFGIGLEKQKRGKRLIHYYGTDLFAQVFKSDDDIYVNRLTGGITINRVDAVERLVQTIRAGLTPFIGIKYYFNEQLSLGIEAGFSAFYFHTKFTEITYETRFINNQFEEIYVENAPVESNGIGIVFNGVRFITLGYAF